MRATRHLAPLHTWATQFFLAVYNYSIVILYKAAIKNHHSSRYIGDERFTGVRSGFKWSRRWKKMSSQNGMVHAGFRHAYQR
jgi:hypothetical protein